MSIAKKLENLTFRLIQKLLMLRLKTLARSKCHLFNFFGYKSYRRHVTLLEALIAMSLSAILITVIVYFYQQLSLINIQMDKAQNEQFQKRFAEYRLNAILPNIAPPSNKDFHFFLSPDTQGLFKENSPSLVFTFDNTIKLDKKMADLVIGRLYLDRENRLTLATWPSPKRWKENESPPMTKEVIMEDVTTLKFDFYYPPDKGPLKIVNKQDSKEVTQKKDDRKLPAIITVLIQKQIDKKIEDISFVYPLPNSPQPIIYKP
jgi:hypothetical protein